MATTKQKEAARRNLVKARKAQSARAHGAKVPRRTRGLSTAEQNDLPDSRFAFPKERKEPLTPGRPIEERTMCCRAPRGSTRSRDGAAYLLAG